MTMSMHDRITVVGNIATVPERRQTATGVPVVTFRLVSNHRRRDPGSGKWIDGATNWYSVSAYRTLAEHALASFAKGQRIIVTGNFRLREWESNGKTGKQAEIDADALGHDLLWGTTAFSRDLSTVESSRAEPPAVEASAAPPSQWADAPVPAVPGDWGAPGSLGLDAPGGGQNGVSAYAEEGAAVPF